jgi:hypothetical protein
MLGALNEPNQWALRCAVRAWDVFLLGVAIFFPPNF